MSTVSPNNPFLVPYKIRCTNCNQYGHHVKNCDQPVSSYGLIAFRINDPSWNQSSVIHSNDARLPLEKIEFLMIQRRNSYGFVEIIRGKYKLDDLSYLRTIIAETTKEEQNALLTQSFEILWRNMWGVENKNYKHDFEVSRMKFQKISAGVEDPVSKQIITLAQLIQENKSSWLTPEWGFPKGKPNNHETMVETAEREFCEETGLEPGDFYVFENVYPFQESFYGTNQTQYKHVYYLAYMLPHVAVHMKKDDVVMAREIGDIKWHSYSDAITRIRDYNNEKKELLLQVHKVLRDYIPLMIGPAVNPVGHTIGYDFGGVTSSGGAACSFEEVEEEVSNREHDDAERPKKTHIIDGKSYASAVKPGATGSRPNG